MMHILFSKTDIFSNNVLKELGFSNFDDIFKINENVVGHKFNSTLNITNDDLVNHNIKLQDNVIVVSKHSSSVQNDPVFTIHYTGNFSKAELGGDDFKLNVPNTHYLNAIFEYLLDNKKMLELKDEQILLEATHHGPTLDVPLLFFEVGPNEIAYNDKKLIDVYVAIIQNIIRGNIDERIRDSVLVIGSGHYLSSTDINKIEQKVNSGEINISHIMPKYAIKKALELNMLEEVLKEAIVKSNADIIYIDRSYVISFGLIKEIVSKYHKRIVY